MHSMVNCDGHAVDRLLGLGALKMYGVVRHYNVRLINEEIVV